MAKLTGAAKAAFLKRMAKGRSKTGSFRTDSGKTTKSEERGINAARKRHSKKPKRSIAQVASSMKPKQAEKMLGGAKKLQAGVSKGVAFWQAVLAKTKKK